MRHLVFRKKKTGGDVDGTYISEKASHVIWSALRILPTHTRYVQGAVFFISEKVRRISTEDGKREKLKGEDFFPPRSVSRSKISNTSVADELNLEIPLLLP